MFDPVLVSLVLLAEGLYLRALRILARRGVRVPRCQIAWWHIGDGAAGSIGLLGPLDASATTCWRRTWPSTC